MRLKTKLQLSVCTLVMAGMIGGAHAQENGAAENGAQDVEAPQSLDEIVVKGIRRSIEDALNTKKQSAGFVDAVNATDVGKLPDNNIAEALQRISGVTIQRTRGEGDFVSIRGLGPDFVRGTVNGRTLLSATESIDPILSGNTITTTGRASNFDILPSELIGSLEVIKTPSAKTVEGGIGGVVNINTARPLDLGTKVSASAEGTYREFGDNLDPKASGLISWRNEDETLGVLFSAAYSQRSIRQDTSRTFGYFNSFGITEQLDTDGNGIGDSSPNDVLFPLSNNNESTKEDRERLTFSGTLQWEPDARTEVTLDAIYSRREIESTTQNFIFLPIIFDADLTALGLQNADSSFNVSNFVENGTFTTLPSSLRPELTTDNQFGDDELFSIALNASREFDDWLLSADISYSDASGGTTFDRVRVDGDGGTFSFLTDVNDGGFSIQELAGSTDIGDPADFILSVLDDRNTTNDDEELAIQLDAERKFDSNYFRSLEFGARYRTRQKSVDRATNGNGISVIGENISLANVGTFNQGASGFLDGDFNSTFSFSDLVFPDNAAARAALAAAGITSPTPADPFGISDIEENTFAIYTQLNLDGQIGGVNYFGDVGVRVVHTRQDVSGFDAVFTITDLGGTDTTIFDQLSTGTATPVNFQDNYTSVLPSINLRFELMEDLFLRVAASKSLTRPTFEDLAPSFSINANSSNDPNADGFAVQLTAGNPALLPYESTNFDAGIEWYFDEGSVFAVNVFYKQIDEFIAGVTDGPATTIAGGTPIRAIGLPLAGGIIDPLPIDQVTQPDNQGEASITGLEVNYQQALPYGFGILANFTLTETTAEFTSTGETIDFPGVSDLTYNLTGYYEDYGFEARLAYSFRSDFLLIPSAVGGAPQQIFVDDFAQLDASIAYNVTDNIQVFANAINLTDREEELFTEISGGIGQRFYSRSIVGRRFGFGARATF